MTREMFSGGHQAFFSRAADVGSRELLDENRVFTERANVDDGIQRVRIHVEHRPEVHVNANGPRFGSEDLSKLVGEILRPGCAERHDGREDSAATLWEEG